MNAISSRLRGFEASGDRCWEKKKRIVIVLKQASVEGIEQQNRLLRTMQTAFPLLLEQVHAEDSAQQGMTRVTMHLIQAMQHTDTTPEAFSERADPSRGGMTFSLTFCRVPLSAGSHLVLSIVRIIAASH